MSLPPKDPLKITLTRPLRIMVMCGLIILFFIISPLIILYTGGWRWNFNTWRVETTGVLSIDTEPDDANVSLNGQYIGNNQPLRLNSLAPGNYQVSISKDGYHTFLTDVTVRSQETTYIRNTTLFANNSPVLVTTTNELISQVSITQANPLRFSFSTTTPGNTSANLTFTDENKTLWTYASGTLYSGTGIEQISVTVPDDVTKIIMIGNNFALLKTKHGLAVINSLYSSPYTTTLSDYENYEYHEATDEWRLWSKWEISSLYRDGARAILYRSAEPIQFVKALEPAGVILIVQNNKLVAFNPGYYASRELAKFENITAITTDENNRLMLIAGTLSDQTGIFSLAY